MPRFPLYLLFTVCVLGCSSQSSEIEVAKVFPMPSQKDSLDFYFPSTLNDPVGTRRKGYENYCQNWFSSTLYSLKEENISKKTDSETVFRFLWLRSFHGPISFTIKKYDNDYYLLVKKLDRYPMWREEVVQHIKDSVVVVDTVKADRFAQIVYSEFKKISVIQWHNIQLLLRQCNFWSLESLEKVNDSMDGSRWIIEGYDRGEYHYVIRKSGQEIRKLGLYLIGQSDKSIQKEEIY